MIRDSVHGVFEIDATRKMSLAASLSIATHVHSTEQLAA